VRRYELRTVIKRRIADAPRRKAATNTSTLIEHGYIAAFLE